MNTSINGVVPVIPTPFDENEAIDLAAVGRLIDFAVDSGAAAVCLPAYGSEFYKLSDAERESLIATATKRARGRVPVIAQANHDSSKIAAELARRFVASGADVISIALPRRFPATDGDLLRYCGQVASAVTVPILIQDFNPGGPTINADFLFELHRQHGNVKLVKLEEPLVIDKLRGIHQRLGDAIGMLTGWGGLYMLDGLSVGSCGIMPGLAICDLFDRVWQAAKSGRGGDVLFANLLPYITFSLQTFELFLAMEKRILVRRGILSNDIRRSLTRTLNPTVMARAEVIIDVLLDWAKGIPQQA
jgi:4-hydroxy-tetrahydrodipicolinate synthase